MIDDLSNVSCYYSTVPTENAIFLIEFSRLSTCIGRIQATSNLAFDFQLLIVVSPEPIPLVQD